MGSCTLNFLGGVQKKKSPCRWTKSGEVVEILPFDSYMVRIHGSRAATQRHRRFLKKITPFKPAVPITEEEEQQARGRESQGAPVLQISSPPLHFPGSAEQGGAGWAPKPVKRRQSR